MNYNDNYRKMSHDFDLKKLNSKFKKQCINGNIDSIKRLLKKGANDFNVGLFIACKYGHINVVKLMLKKGANDINVGFYKACKYGHLNVINLLIENGANDFPLALEGICKNLGNFIIAKQLVDIISKKNESNNVDFGDAFEIACVYNNKKIIKYMIKKGASQNNLNVGFRASCEEGHRDIVLLLKKYVDDITIDWGLSGAMMTGQQDIINIIKEWKTKI